MQESKLLTQLISPRTDASSAHTASEIAAVLLPHVAADVLKLFAVACRSSHGRGWRSQGKGNRSSLES